MIYFRHIHILLLLFLLFFSGTPKIPTKIDTTKQIQQTTETAEVSSDWNYFFEKNGSWLAVLLVGSATILVNLYLAYRNGQHAFSMMRTQILTSNVVKINQDWCASFKQNLSEFLKLATILDGGSDNIKKSADEMLEDIGNIIQLKYYIELSLGQDPASLAVASNINQIIDCIKQRGSNLPDLKITLIANAQILLRSKVQLITS